MKELMVDIETLGTGYNSAIVSIGAVFFDFETGEIGPKFLERISIKDSLERGFEVDGDTIEWWLQQDKAAQEHLLVNPISVPNALTGFVMWWQQHASNNCNVWGNGATFDNVLLTNAFNRCGMERPWAFWSDMDVRTLVHLSGIKRPRTVAGTAHTPIDDCMHQINYCIKAWEKINGTGK